jgi:subtilisin family serine protease
MKNPTWRKILPSLILMLIFCTAVSSVAANPKPPKPTPSSASVKIEPDLAQAIAQTNRASYLIYFRDKTDLSAAYDMPWEERGWYVMNALQESAQRSQRSVRAYLDSQGIPYQSFWIDNIIIVEDSDADSVNSLMSFPEIEALRARRNPILFTPDDRSPTIESTSIESNLTHVHADEVWSLGYTGEGIVVANIDTGVRYTHQALVTQYRGNLGGGSYNHNYNWWDPYLLSTTPSDFDSHGSHTMGTILGDDGGSNQIGMAPSAEWIACKSFQDGDVDAQLLECAQFMLAPWDLSGSNANPSKRPHVVNNSWGDCSQAYDDWYEDTISAWLAAGIYPVFSNGNASNCGYSYPPGLNTVGNPARYGNVTGVGATGTSNGIYATYSNWGPTDNADTVNPNGYPYLKPQVVAPGTNRSAINSSDSSYSNMSGTSMAAPHVAGLVALMWSAAPCLIGDYAATETIIEQSANPIPYDDGTGGGAHTPNNATGWGEIDALAAVEAAINSCSPFIIEPNPDNLDVCVPDNAEYDLHVNQADPSFTDPVTLSTDGVPTGYAPSFSSNPVTPGSSSTLTLTGSLAATHGSYTIKVHGTAPTSTYTTNISLNLYTATPGDVTLISPSDDASDVSLQPTFTWQSAAQAGTYKLEIANDSQFIDIVSSVDTNFSSYKPTTRLDQLSTYYWRVTPSNACASGNTSAVYSFTTLETAPIMLVDDDDNDPDVRTYYTSTLDSLGLAYNIWDTNYSDNEPTETDLLPYELVIWFTGASWGGYAGPSSSSESALGSWLRKQNCFFISSQEYHWDRGLTYFMKNYLGVSSITDDDGYYTSVSGLGEPFSGLGPYSLTYPFYDWSDIINPLTPTQVAWRGNNSHNAALSKDAGLYRTTYWAFPFEALSSSARQESLQNLVDWCNAIPIFDNIIYLLFISK